MQRLGSGTRLSWRRQASVQVEQQRKRSTSSGTGREGGEFVEHGAPRTKGGLEAADPRGSWRE